MRVIAVVAGPALVVGVVRGMVDTLVPTRLRISRRGRLSTWLPALAWPVFRSPSRWVQARDSRRGLAHGRTIVDDPETRT